MSLNTWILIVIGIVICYVGEEVLKHLKAREDCED